MSTSTGQLGLPLTPEAGEEFTEALGLVLAGGIRLTEWGKDNGIPAILGLSDEEWLGVWSCFFKRTVSTREQIRQVFSLSPSASEPQEARP